MLESGEYSWNSGMFIWQVERILAEFQKQMPDFYAQLETLSACIGQASYDAALQQIWPKVRKETIDYGIMEEAANVAVIPVSIGWADVGSWGSLFELLPPDADGNIWTGPHIAIDTHGTLAFSEKRLVAAIGVDGLVIVDTPDALLVCTRAREQDVKAVVQQLKEGNLKQWL